jgi:hypothetical protein
LIGWTLGIFGALFLYVATWPPIDIKFSHVVLSSHSLGPSTGSGFSGSFSGTYYSVVTKPVWLGVLYRPLEILGEFNEGDNPLTRYYMWWWSILQ